MPSLIPSLSPHDHSEASSFSETSSTQITSLIDRIASLLSRMVQTDPLTLTNRLKRQHLKGADVGHLSKTTISNILAEVNGLRQQYRSLLEEDKAALPVTRKDLRGLFKFLRDAFLELGQIRSTLNDIILDPSLAPKISEQALHPEQEKDLDKASSTNSAAHSWIAPISKLFSPRNELPPPTLTRSSSSRNRNTRFILKSGPALAASATTVNVEFSGIGGRSTTSATAAPAITQSPPPESTTALMDIFAGAPQLSNSTSTSTDNWVVIPPSAVRRMPSLMQLGPGGVEYPSDGIIVDGTRTIGRNTVLPIPKAEIPRAVDAVIDERTEADDRLAPLLQRTLIRRGLSDSSIHSTFVAHGQGSQETQTNGTESQAHRSLGGVFRTAWPDSSSVFQALSRTVHNLKLGGSSATGSESEPNSVTDPAHKDAPTETAPSLTKASEASVTETAVRTRTPPPSLLQPQPQTPAHASSSKSAVTANIMSPTSKSPSSISSATSPKSPKERKAATISPRKGRMPDFTPWAAASFMLDPASGVSDPFVARNVAGSFREESFRQRTLRSGDEI